MSDPRAPESHAAEVRAAGRHGIDDRIRQENLVLRDMVTIYSRLSGLAAQDTEVAAVLQVLATRLNVSAALLDTDLNVIASAAPTGLDEFTAVLGNAGRDTLRRLATAAAKTRRSLTSAESNAAAIILVPIMLGDDLSAYLVTAADVVDERTEDVRLMVTEHAAMVCGIVVGRARVVAAAAGQARRDLYEGLLLPDRNEAEAENWARHLGIKPDAPHRVATFAITARSGAAGAGTDTGRTDVAEFVERFVYNRVPDATLMTRTDEVVAVLSADAEDQTAALRALTTLARSCKAELEQRFHGTRLTIGIGNCHLGATRISRSYAEARRAVATSEVLTGLGGVVVFEDLGIHRLLALVPDVDELRSFAGAALGSLLDPDRPAHQDLLTTLTVYFQENNSPQRTARRLHMHPNTVAYRIKRIEEIAGISLASYSDRLIMQVALEIVNGLGESR